MEVTDGFLNVLKPPGMTSHDVVGYLRRLFGVKRVGHAGTLDPGVPGVLPVGVGKATRLIEYLSEADKAYRAEVCFGAATDTQDDYGTVTAESSAAHLTEEAVRQALVDFVGPYRQIPPMMSAVKVGGKRLYDLARQGIDAVREPRIVQIRSVSVLRFSSGERPTALFDVVCSKGTYIRTLCADLGERLGTVAHMSYLVRTRSGPFALDAAITLERLESETHRNKFLQPLTAALGNIPRVEVAAHFHQALRNGVAPRLPKEPAIQPGKVALVSTDGELLAMAEVLGEPAGEGLPDTRTLKVKKVFVD